MRTKVSTPSVPRTLAPVLPWPPLGFPRENASRPPPGGARRVGDRNRGIGPCDTDYMDARLEEARQITLEAVTQAISKIIESCDPYTSGHQHRVAAIATAIAREMGLSDEAVQGMTTAGLLHDLGMIAVPSEIVSRPCRLSPVEMDFVRMHPATGYQILKGIEFPWPIADAAYQHHERMDGSGYPRQLLGQDILLEARILGVADVVEAMASHRPYRPAVGIEKALEEVQSNAGTLYDRDVSNSCVRLFQDKGFQIPT